MANWLAKVQKFLKSTPNVQMDGKAEGIYAMLEHNNVPGKGASYLDDAYNASRTFLLTKYEVQGCAVTPDALRGVIQQGIRDYVNAIHTANGVGGLQIWDNASVGADLPRTAKEAQPFINQAIDAHMSKRQRTQGGAGRGV